MAQPFISRSEFTAPPDSRGPGASYIGEPVWRPRGVSAPSGEPLPPPDWWDADNPRCGRTAGGAIDPNVLAEWWLTLSEDSDAFLVQVTAEDRIVRQHVERATYSRVAIKPNRERFDDPVGLQRLITAATAAVELLAG